MTVDAALLTVAGTFVAAAALVFLVAALAARSWKTKSEAEEEEEEDSRQTSPTKKAPPQAKAKKATFPTRGKREEEWSHAWLATTLRGHQGTVTDADFAPSGKHLVTAADDRSLLLWTVKNFDTKQHNSVRGAVELDHARLIRFAPDSRSMVLALGYANEVGVYKLEKKEAGGVRIVKIPVDFPKAHVQDVHSLGISCTGKWLLTASSEAELAIWGLRGELLTKLPTHQSTIHHKWLVKFEAAASPCGRFAASSGFTPDVRVWEVRFSKAGEFQELGKAFELKGHTSGVWSFAFNQDSSRMVSASKDGSLRLWDTDVRWEHKQAKESQAFLDSIGV